MQALRCIANQLEAQADVPLRTGIQRQGDVLVAPMRPGNVAGLAPVPPEGIPVVRGESGGNTHLLVADGDVTWAPAGEREPLMLGTLCVGPDSAAYLIHPEHGATGMAPGLYGIRRQREQADEIRLVAD
jgi:hypothetical protein